MPEMRAGSARDLPAILSESERTYQRKQGFATTTAGTAVVPTTSSALLANATADRAAAVTGIRGAPPTAATANDLNAIGLVLAFARIKFRVESGDPWHMGHRRLSKQSSYQQ